MVIKKKATCCSAALEVKRSDKDLLLQLHNLRTCWISQKALLMAAQLRLLSFWVLLLLVATLCPAACAKRGASSKGRGKGNGDKEPPSQGRGLSKQGLKWAGAAAAGMLGGTGTGYGLGFLGKPKHGTGNHHGRKTAASGQQEAYYQENQRYNQSVRRAYSRGAAPANGNIFLILGHVVPLIAWIINK